jgi:hypothetical protein
MARSIFVCFLAKDQDQITYDQLEALVDLKDA